MEYLEKLKQPKCQREKQPCKAHYHQSTRNQGKRQTITSGSWAVQEYVQSLREANRVVNAVVVMAAAEGIISARNISKLSSHRGRTNITKSWARSLLNRIWYVKQKCSTSGKIPPAQFEESRDIFLIDVAAEVVMNEIPRDLIVNWEQTALSIIYTGDWTMEKQGAKVIPIANADDKSQLTAMLVATPGGEYLPSQLLYRIIKN